MSNDSILSADFIEVHRHRVSALPCPLPCHFLSRSLDTKVGSRHTIMPFARFSRAKPNTMKQTSQVEPPVSGGTKPGRVQLARTVAPSSEPGSREGAFPAIQSSSAAFLSAHGGTHHMVG